MLLDVVIVSAGGSGSADADLTGGLNAKIHKHNIGNAAYAAGRGFDRVMREGRTRHPG